jgi:hypothetical protein
MEITDAHKHSIRHRDEVLTSDVCGCFYCLAVFAPGEIKDGTICEAEIHWFEAHGIGRKDFKVKRVLP